MGSHSTTNAFSAVRRSYCCQVFLYVTLSEEPAELIATLRSIPRPLLTMVCMRVVRAVLFVHLPNPPPVLVGRQSCESVQSKQMKYKISDVGCCLESLILSEDSELSEIFSLFKTQFFVFLHDVHLEIHSVAWITYYFFSLRSKSSWPILPKH